MSTNGKGLWTDQLYVLSDSWFMSLTSILSSFICAYLVSCYIYPFLLQYIFALIPILRFWRWIPRSWFDKFEMLFNKRNCKSAVYLKDNIFLDSKSSYIIIPKHLFLDMKQDLKFRMNECEGRMVLIILRISSHISSLISSLMMFDFKPFVLPNTLIFLLRMQLIVQGCSL